MYDDSIIPALVRVIRGLLTSIDPPDMYIASTIRNEATALQFTQALGMCFMCCQSCRKCAVENDLCIVNIQPRTIEIIVKSCDIKFLLVLLRRI